MMSEIELRHKVARFGDYELDCSSGRLSTQGQGLSIEPLIFQFLILLIRHNGNVVSKQTVIDSLWPSKKPSDEALRAMVKKAREVLKDNARNPSYIKTIPTKGYLLIPNVVLSSTIIQTWCQKNRTLLIYAGLLVTFAAIALYFSFFSEENSSDSDEIKAISKTEISLIDSNKVNAYYVNENLSNIAIMDNAKLPNSQVVIEKIVSKERLNFAFHASLESQFWWSEHLNTLLVTRSDDNGFYSIELDLSGHNHLVIDYDYKLSDDYKILALAKQGIEVYALNKKENRVDIINFVTQNIEPFFSINDFSDKQERQIFDGIWINPSNGSVFVSLSNNSTFRIYEILESMHNNESVNVHHTLISELNGALESAIWDINGKRFSFSLSTGQLFSYQTEAKVLTSWATRAENVKGLVADCGDSCFIISNTKGLSKLSLIHYAEGFYQAEGSYQAKGSQNATVLMSSNNSKPRAENLPLFWNDELYYVASSNKNNAIMHLDLSSTNAQEATIYDFGKNAKITELVINKNGNLLFGLVNQRPFIFDLDAQELRYLSITFPEISNLSFSESTKVAFYAMPVNKPSGVYELDLSNDQVALKHANVRFTQNLLLTANSDTGKTRHRAELIIDEQFTAKVVYQSGKEDLQLNLYHDACLACIHISENYLYQVNTGIEPSLVKINLLSGESSSEVIAIDALSREFSQTASADKIALISRQHLQTKLIKLEGLTQVF